LERRSQVEVSQLHTHNIMLFQNNVNPKIDNSQLLVILANITVEFLQFVGYILSITEGVILWLALIG
jgi:hypothetical protein